MTKTFKIQQKFRTSHLSKKPGGVTVYVKEKTGPIKEYDKVKYPESYIAKLLKSDDVVEAWIKK